MIAQKLRILTLICATLAFAACKTPDNPVGPNTLRQSNLTKIGAESSAKRSLLGWEQRTEVPTPIIRPNIKAGRGHVKKPADPTLPKRFPHKHDSDSPTIPPGDVDFGTGLGMQPGTDFVFAAAHSVDTSVNLAYKSVNTLLYAPTLLGANACPLEAVTVYEGTAGLPGTKQWFGVWDHSLPEAPAGQPPTNHWITKGYWSDAWMAQHLGNIASTGTATQGYWVEIATGTYGGVPAWVVLMYNFNTHNWDFFGWESRTAVNHAGANGATVYTGWDFFEHYFNGTCPTLPSIRATNIQIWNSRDGWRGATDSFASPGQNAFDLSIQSPPCPGYSRNYNVRVWDWQVN